MNNNILNDIDFLIPIYNGQDFIEKCYQSIRFHFPKNKIFFCNDGSTDKTNQILSTLSICDKNISIITNKEKMGTAYSRNILLNCSNKKYVWFIDVDDTIRIFNMHYLKKQLLNEPDFIILKLENSISSVENSIKFKIRFLPWFFKKIIIFLKKSKITDYIFSPNKKYDSMNDQILSFSWCCSVNKIFNRTFLIKNNFKFPNYYYEDLIIIYYILLSDNFYINTYVYYIIGENKNSKTRSIGSKEKQKDLISSFNNLMSLLNKNDIQKNNIFFENFKKITFGK